MLYGEHWRLPRFWNFRCRCKSRTERKASVAQGIGGNHRHRLPVSRKYRERGYDPQLAGYHTAYQSMWTSRGTVLQSRGHAGGKRTAAAYQSQTEALSRAIFGRHRRRAWRGAENWKISRWNGGCVSILRFRFFRAALLPFSFWKIQDFTGR